MTSATSYTHTSNYGGYIRLAWEWDSLGLLCRRVLNV